ncbi:hypothetical protein [Thalassospira alkalitolerans]|uniref:hypothetical protein n=1 Tax=Thalassospira alkalitolerans TaxID=1293890 RepID=UPI003AA86B20
MSIVKVNQKQKKLEVGEFSTENDIVFNYFSNLPSESRDESLIRAIYIGVLALMEDRLSSFLSKTSNELGTELESLKRIFDMRQELFYKTSVKGIVAEEDVLEYLNDFFKNISIKDRAVSTGTMRGALPRNKTGDIVCYINDDDSLKIVVECKFDKSIRMGDISEKDIFTRKSDTIWSQLIESQINREAKVSIIVLDKSLTDSVVLRNVHNVRYISQIGFVVIVDSQKGDFSNISIAYMLARNIATAPLPDNADRDMLYIIVSRLVRDIIEVSKIKNMIMDNIDNNKKILSHIEKSILMIEFNELYLKKFLSDGYLSKNDLMDFYSGDEVRKRFKDIESELDYQ